ncbi:MAG: hypothetical protein ACLP3B_08385, partial [Syntrophobacteraceae bacterium]
RFSCAFSSSCSTNTFQVRKPTKVLLQIGFLCASSCPFVFFVTLAGLENGIGSTTLKACWPSAEWQ